MQKSIKRVMIAQQGTITPYRIPLYEAMEKRRPPQWEFHVVNDVDPAAKHDFYKGQGGQFKFRTLDVRSHTFSFLGVRLMWQHIFARARKYDVIVTDTYVKHLTYVALFIYRLFGIKRVWWGIPSDLQARNPSVSKRIAEAIKARILHLTDHFLAYTPGSRNYLVKAGYPEADITVLFNTIDIRAERVRFQNHRAASAQVRESLGINIDKRVLLYVGRLTKLKQVPQMMDMIRELHRIDSRYMLLVIGSGREESLVRKTAQALGPEVLQYLGTVDDPEETACIYAASDLYYVPSYVGLGPLQAFSYDLPVIARELDWHSPEVEYLNEKNSAFLSSTADTPARQAAEIVEIAERLLQPGFRAGIYGSVSHLTIEAMADNFICGINKVLGLPEDLSADNPNEM